MSEPKLYLSTYREQDGLDRYTVIYQGVQLMEVTLEAAKALAHLEKVEKQVSIKTKVYWDGKIGQFKPFDELRSL